MGAHATAAQRRGDSFFHFFPFARRAVPFSTSTHAAAFTFSFLFLLGFLSGLAVFCAFLFCKRCLVAHETVEWCGARGAIVCTAPRDNPAVRFLFPSRRVATSRNERYDCEKTVYREEKKCGNRFCMLFAAARAFRFFSVFGDSFSCWVECAAAGSFVQNQEKE